MSEHQIDDPRDHESGAPLDAHKSRVRVNLSDGRPRAQAVGARPADVRESEHRTVERTIEVDSDRKLMAGRWTHFARIFPEIRNVKQADFVPSSMENDCKHDRFSLLLIKTNRQHIHGHKVAVFSRGDVRIEVRGRRVGRPIENLHLLDHEAEIYELPPVRIDAPVDFREDRVHSLDQIHLKLVNGRQK